MGELVAVIVGAIGFNTRVTTLLCNEIAPARESALPSNEEPSNKLIALLQMSF